MSWLQTKIFLYDEFVEPISVPRLPAPELSWKPEYYIPRISSGYNPPTFIHHNYFVQPELEAYYVIPETGNLLVGIVNHTETWEEHFLSRGWNTIEDQINAGFPYYLQPTLEKGDYQEEHDFGIVYSNVIVTVKFSTVIVVGQITVTTSISTSEDGVVWTTPIVATSLFVPSMRFVRVKLHLEALE